MPSKMDDALGIYGFNLIPDGVEMRSYNFTVGSVLGGRFLLKDGREITGEVVVGEAETTLHLFDDDFFTLSNEDRNYISGTLHDKTNIHIIDYFIKQSSGYKYIYGKKYCFAKLICNIIAYGHNFSDLALKNIAGIKFYCDDFEYLFDDFDSFGVCSNPENHINNIIAEEEKLRQRPMPSGDDPQIFYFSGRSDIAKLDTLIGSILITHEHNIPFFGHQKSLGMKTNTIISVENDEGFSLESGIRSIVLICRFLELIAGRPQTVDWTRATARNGEIVATINIHWRGAPKRSKEHESQRPHPSDILIDATRNTAEFCSVLSRWIEINRDLAEARFRFSEGFRNQNFYPIDRLIGAANIFDLLPDQLKPDAIKLPEGLIEACNEAKALFRLLPKTPERDTALSSLARIGKPSLSDIVLYRKSKIPNSVLVRMRDIETVIRESINCRNRFVHGTIRKIDYSKSLEMIFFFTMTLEFIFAASDLVECGWDMEQWATDLGVQGHPFASLLRNWDWHINKLEQLRQQAGNS